MAQGSHPEIVNNLPGTMQQFASASFQLFALVVWFSFRAAAPLSPSLSLSIWLGCFSGDAAISLGLGVLIAKCLSQCQHLSRPFRALVACNGYVFFGL